MSALSRFEDFFERMMEGSFAKLFNSAIQPAELASKLARAMEGNQSVGAGKVYVPNRYDVYLSAADFASFRPFRVSLERELSEYLLNLAREHEYAFLSRPVVELKPDEDLSPRSIRVAANMVDVESEDVDAAARKGLTQRIPVARDSRPAARRHAVLYVRGEAMARGYQLARPIVTLGRSLDNNIVLEDKRVSRHHAQIKFRFGQHCLYDLGSTNGTFVNGERASEIVLRKGDVVSLGGLELVYEQRPEEGNDVARL